MPDFQQIIPTGISRPIYFMGADIYYFQHVDSTSNVALAMAQHDAPEGTTVVAECQSSGRGQRGNSWFSPPKAGIYISTILRPKPEFSDMNHIKLLAAVAMANCVSSISGLAAGIKWPNDVMLNGRKIGGILVETEWSGGSPQYFVVGAGINVNHTADMFKEAAVPNATSLRIELGHECDWDIVLQQFLIEMEKTYLIYQSRGFDPIWQQIKEMETITGSWVEVVALGHRFEGEALGIGADGELLVRSGDVVRKIYNGRISILSHNYHKVMPMQTKKVDPFAALSNSNKG